MSSNNSLAGSIVSPQAIRSVQQYLAQFAATDDFEGKIETAFGTKTGAAAIRQQWLSGDFSLIPAIKVLSDGELGTANGAYAASLDEIFVSSDFLAQHQGDIAAVSELLLEEIGHKIDTVLNGNLDSPGDEGAIFRLLATGQSLSDRNLAGLRTQDDHAVITVDRQSVAVEEQDFVGTNGNDILTGTSGDDRFNPGAGADSIDGKEGKDTVFINSSGDTIINYTTTVGGTITGGSKSGTTFQNIEIFDIGTGNGNDYINISATSDGGIELLNSGPYARVNRISSGGGNDTIIGGSGDDVFSIGGAASIDGGAGKDNLSITNSTSKANININYTTATNGTITNGPNNGTTFQNIEIASFETGSGNDYINVSATNAVTDLSRSYLYGGTTYITSGSGNDTIIGGTGDDVFRSVNAPGADSIDGGIGNDTLIVSNFGDTATTSINYTTTTNGTITGGSSNGTTFQNIEEVNFTTGSGNDYINVTAASGGRFLFGGPGNDTYVLSRTTGGRSFILDSVRTNGLGSPSDPSAGANDTLSLVGGTSLTISEISRTGADLQIDLNQDGTFNQASDLLVKNYFAADTGSSAGSGFIENMDGLSGSTILSLYTSTRNGFIGGDRNSDILWRNDYGSVALWQMDGATVTSGSLTSVPNIDPSWTVAGTGDFDDAGGSDILWRNTSGAVAVWKMDGYDSTVLSSSLTSTPSLDNSWKTVGTGDYNGDGKSDILWRNTSGAVAVWTMNGATVTSSALTSTPTLAASWKVAGNSDFNGDGKADILWRNDDGSVALWQMNGAAITASTAVSKVATDWKIAGSDDFDGDGKADILWRNDDGRVALWQMNGAAITSSSLTSNPSRDSSQTVAGIGDYNGDGKADILWRKDTGALEIWQMNGSTVVSSTLTSVAADGSNWKIAAPII